MRRYLSYWGENLRRSFQDYRWLSALLGLALAPAIIAVSYLVINDLIDRAYQSIFLAFIAALLVCIIAGMTFFRTPYVMWRDDRAMIAEFEERSKPKLAILYQDGFPFTQINALRNADGATATQKLHRIGIWNTSAGVVENIRVHLVAIEPNIVPFIDINLHVMHDNPGPYGDYITEFDLNPDQKRYVDIASMLETDKGFNISDIQLWYAVRGISSTMIPRSDYELTIRVTAMNIQAIYKKINLTIAHDGLFQCKLIDA